MGRDRREMGEERDGRAAGRQPKRRDRRDRQEIEEEIKELQEEYPGLSYAAIQAILREEE